jgi:predicted RNase H-like HicB family nuclease
MTSVETTTAGDPITFARVLEIEGCFGQGENRAAAIQDLRLALVDFIESLLADGLPVPGPAQLNPTLGTASYSVFTFVKEGKKLQPRPIDVNQDAYILSV